MILRALLWLTTNSKLLWSLIIRHAVRVAPPPEPCCQQVFWKEKLFMIWTKLILSLKFYFCVKILKNEIYFHLVFCLQVVVNREFSLVASHRSADHKVWGEQCRDLSSWEPRLQTFRWWWSEQFSSSLLSPHCPLTQISWGTVENDTSIKNYLTTN